MTAAPYSPVEGVTLDPYGTDRGTLLILDRAWPVRNVCPVFPASGIAAGWMAESWFENGAVVLFVANDERTARRTGWDVPRYFGASLHHQFGHLSNAYRPPWGDDGGLPTAGISSGHLTDAADLLYWALHEDPEPDWLNGWLDRVARLAVAPSLRSAS